MFCPASFKVVLILSNLRQVLFSSIALCAVLLVGALGTTAQSVTSGLRGVVTDQQNAVVPGAEIELLEPSTNIKKTATTDSNGNYEFSDLKPGTYKISVNKQGFTGFVAENILIENLQIRRIDAQLQVAGSGTNTVTIDAGAALITTEGGTITSTFTKDKVADNPAFDTYPSPNSLLITQPGVQVNGGNGYELKVSGLNSSQQTLGLDGAINDRHVDQNNNINFYEEANITTINATADNARAVNYNLVSKRGQNQFHGMIYYRRFDSTFGARDFFDSRKFYQIQHEGQAEVSGPIWKDKTFFYFSWFYQRVPSGTVGRPQTPSAAAKAGDFTSLLSRATPMYLKDPLSTNPCTNIDQSGCIKDPSRATASNPQGLNLIPANRISSVSSKFQSYYPLPNGVAQNGRGQFEYFHPFPGDYFETSFPFVRIDHKFSDKNSIYAKYTKKRAPYVIPGSLPQFFYTRVRDHGQFSATDTHIFSSNLVNTFTFGMSRDLIQDGVDTAEGFEMLDGNEVISETGIQGMNPGGLKGKGFPTINISNYASLAATAGGIKTKDRTLTFDNNLNWSIGKHSLKLGGNYNRFKIFAGEVPNYGSVTFNGNFARGSQVNPQSGLVTPDPVQPEHAYATFLLGIPSASNRNTPRINRERNVDELGLYITDTIKVSQKLTLDFGIRWDYYGIITYKDGIQYNFDPTTGNVIIAPGTRGEVDPRYPSGITIVEGEVVPKADKNNFRPRLAAAYRFSDDFVLRGGYGQFTERFSRGYTDFALGGGPLNRTGEAFTNSITNGVPRFTFPRPFVEDNSGRSVLGAQSVSGFPLQSRDGVIHQYNVSLEKELLGLGWRASYIGTRGQNLRSFVQLNAPVINADGNLSTRKYPQFAQGFYNNFNAAGVTYLRDDFASSYNALQFEVQKRRGDFTFNAHYTYAVTKNNIKNSQDPFNPTAQWANDGDVRRNMFVATTSWHVPVGRGKQFLSGAPGVVDAILGGWRLQTITYIGSGLYVTPYSCGFNNEQYGANQDGCVRPNQNGDSRLPRGERSLTRWFDPTVYSNPAPGTYGNALANSIEGPGLYVHHLSAAKSFTFKERFRTTFTAGIANIFNHPNFGTPDSDIYFDDEYSGQSVYYTLGSGTDHTPENAGRRVIYFKLRFEF